MPSLRREEDHIFFSYGEAAFFFFRNGVARRFLPNTIEGVPH